MEEMLNLLGGVSSVVGGGRRDAQHLGERIELGLRRLRRTSADINDMLLRLADLLGDLSIRQSLPLLRGGKSGALRVGCHVKDRGRRQIGFVRVVVIKESWYGDRWRANLYRSGNLLSHPCTRDIR